MNSKVYMFDNRLMVVILFKIFLIILLISRLFFLQVIDQKKYNLLSDRNRIRITLTPAFRGDIEDRNQIVVVNSVPYYKAIVQCKNEPCLKKCRQVLLQKKFPVHWEELTKKDKRPFILKERLSWKEIALLEAHKSDLPMMNIQTFYERHYVMDTATPHFLGYTSRIPENHPYAKKLPFSNVGRSGLEKLMDSKLFGQPSLLAEEINAYGESIRTLSFSPAIKGQTLRLTIDSKLQSFAYDQLKPHKSGAVVVLDIHSGDILALASYPGFNPGIFERGLTQKEWDNLRQDIKTPLLDKAIMGVYPPGSIIKPLIALAALEEGYITKETKFLCNGKIIIDGKTCHCWKKEGHGLVNLEAALRGSCNIYMYEIAKLMPLEQMTKWLTHFGLGESTGFPVPGEKKGLVPSKEWKLKYRKEKWRRIDTVYSSIGQGYILATPLQLAKMMAQLVNGGYELQPNIFYTSIPAEKKELNKLNASSDRLDFLKNVMGQVVNHPNGTGYYSRPMNVSWKMGGKSGTAQVRKITQKERDENRHHGYDWDWKERDHALFAGFAPLDHPKYVVVVLVEHGGFGGMTAAPIGRDIMKFILNPDE